MAYVNPVIRGTACYAFIIKKEENTINSEPDLSSEVAYSYHILYTFAHVYHMRQRGVVSDNEWTGWLWWMKSAFRHGNIREIWKNNVEVEKWFDPAFQEFINKE
jgi:hypothetical protein